MARSKAPKKRTEFQQAVREDVEALCDERGLDVDNNKHRGEAFQLWLALLMGEAEPQFRDLDPDDALSRGRDLGVDFVLEDEANRVVRLVQAKYANNFDGDELVAFLARHEDLIDPEWVAKHGNETARLTLLDYQEWVNASWNIEYWFVTTADVPERGQEVSDKRAAAYRDRDLLIDCRALGSTELRAYRDEAISKGVSIPEEIHIDLPSDQFLDLKGKQHETLIAVVKGNSLRGLYRKHRQSLFAFNIRGYLGANATNKQMKGTAETRPEEFYYFNNGISAICTDFEVDGNKLTAKKFQIINGAQTVATLGTSAPNPRIEVLMRLTRTKSTATDSGINQDIIRYNNTQNVIKVSDFRSNDSIQIFLEQQFRSDKARGVVPKFHYSPKRLGPGRRAGRSGKGVRLEEFGKIRYAFLYEPTLVHASPRDLWTLKADNGVYEDAFGVAGELEAVWTRATLDEAVLALVLFLQIDTDTKAVKKDFPYLNRLKYHLLSLAAEAIRESGMPAGELLDKAVFDHFYVAFKQAAFEAVADVAAQKLDPQGPEPLAIFGLVRSAVVWEEMTKRVDHKRRAKAAFG